MRMHDFFYNVFYEEDSKNTFMYLFSRKEEIFFKKNFTKDYNAYKNKFGR